MKPRLVSERMNPTSGYFLRTSSSVPSFEPLSTNRICFESLSSDARMLPMHSSTRCTTFQATMMIETSYMGADAAGSALGGRPVHLLEHADVVVLVRVDVAVLVPVAVQVLDDVRDVVARLEPEHRARLLRLYLVVPEVADVLDLEIDALPEQLLHLVLHLVADLTDRVVVGGDVEDAADAVVGLDRAQVA